MCGRYKLTSSAEEFRELFGLAEIHRVAPRYNIAPTQPIEIVRLRPETSIREMQPVVWGLIPPWCTDVSTASKMINARAETLHQKPSYKNPLKRRRCLVPADGFYEWKKVKGGKQPYLIQRADGKPFAFAGLWEVWHGPNGEEIESCTIVTTEAIKSIRELHDRMPVIMPPELYDKWLDRSCENCDELVKLLMSAPPQELKVTPVSKAVNDVRNDSPECVSLVATEEIQLEGQQELF